MSVVEVDDATFACTVPIVTTSVRTASNPVPEMVTRVPGTADVGVKPPIVGGAAGPATVNGAGVVTLPFVFVSVIGPVVAPTGTVAVS